MKRYLIFNWKNYLTSPEGDGIFNVLKKQKNGFPDDEIILAPDLLHLARFADQKSGGIEIAVQDISVADHHPHTGGTSVEQVDNVAKYAIVGHSERRRYDEESYELIEAKVKTVADSNLDLIFCVGETKKTYDYSGIKVEIAHQMEAIRGYPRGILLCYEPSWAIGSGSIPGQDILADIFSFILEKCEDMGVDDWVHLIYGGSVDATNIDDILDVPGCEGVIIGTASVSERKVEAIFDTLRET